MNFLRADPVPYEGRIQEKVIDIENYWTHKRPSAARYVDSHSRIFDEPSPTKEQMEHARERMLNLSRVDRRGRRYDLVHNGPI